MLDEQDTVLLGRVTFSEWRTTGRPRPTSRSRAGSTARRSTSRPTTLDSVDGWSNSTLIKGSVPTSSASCASSRADDRHGGQPVAGAVAGRGGLVDELTLMISPVVAGGGRARLFPADSAQHAFELVEAKPTSSGTVIASYRPAR
jgi:dihydrofolate reductase